MSMQMMEQPKGTNEVQDEPIRRREGTLPQKIRFTPGTMAQLREYAGRNNVSLSAVVEHLVLVGLGKPNSEIGLEQATRTLRAEMLRVHNLLIGLLKQTYLESAIASRASLAVLRRHDERGYGRTKELIRADAAQHMKQSSSLSQLTKYLEEVEIGADKNDQTDN